MAQTPPSSAPRLRELLSGRAPEPVHLLGAGGAGVSGVGRILHSRGVRVTGCDTNDSELLQELRKLGLDVLLGESRAKDLPADAGLVIRSAAVPATDPQVERAEEQGIPVLKYGEALALLSTQDRTLVIAGTHGKTTATWMLWHALEGVADELGGPISGALIGGLCRRLGTNALAGSEGGWFCVEGCEYDRTFHNLRPFAAAITNVEEDHLDYYGDWASLVESFAHFASLVHPDGVLVLGREVPHEVEHAARARVLRLGRELEVELLAEHRGHFEFDLSAPSWTSPAVRLAVPGHFNVENSALALALAIELGMGGLPGGEVSKLSAAAAHGLEGFTGVARRFEAWGSDGGVHVVHDYAHHPTEVRVTLEAARRAFPDRPLHVLFQPHQHSRTARFLEPFAESLRSADRVVIADVYGARLHIDGTRFAGAPELVLALRRRGVEALEGGPAFAAIEPFVQGVGDRAAALVLGAGDVEDIRDELLDQLALRRTFSGESRL